MAKTWNDLVSRVYDDVFSTIERNTRYPEDDLGEIVDSIVPVYNGDRLDVLNDNPSLAYFGDSDIGVSGCTNIYDILGVTIYEALYQEAVDALQQLKDLWEEQDEAGDEFESWADDLLDEVRDGETTKEDARNQLNERASRVEEDMDSERYHKILSYFAEELAEIEEPVEEDEE